MEHRPTRAAKVNALDRFTEGVRRLAGVENEQEVTASCLSEKLLVILEDATLTWMTFVGVFGQEEEALVARGLLIWVERVVAGQILFEVIKAIQLDLHDCVWHILVVRFVEGQIILVVGVCVKAEGACWPVETEVPVRLSL